MYLRRHNAQGRCAHSPLASPLRASVAVSRLSLRQVITRVLRTCCLHPRVLNDRAPRCREKLLERPALRHRLLLEDSPILRHALEPHCGHALTRHVASVWGERARLAGQREHAVPAVEDDKGGVVVEADASLRWRATDCDTVGQAMAPQSAKKAWASGGQQDGKCTGGAQGPMGLAAEIKVGAGAVITHLGEVVAAQHAIRLSAVVVRAEEPRQKSEGGNTDI